MSWFSFEETGKLRSANTTVAVPSPIAAAWNRYVPGARVAVKSEVRSTCHSPGSTRTASPESNVVGLSGVPDAILDRRVVVWRP